MPVYKIAMIGDGGVGKTALRERYLGKDFTPEYLLTIGADFSMCDDHVNGTPIRYQVWDLAGQKRFDCVREAYYRGCIGALLVYDISRSESFFNMPKWINELWSKNGFGRVPIIVVSNKIDLRKTRDEFQNLISPQQGKEFTFQLNKITEPDGFNCHFIETSAKTGVNVSQAFALLGMNIMRFLKTRRVRSPSILIH
ncbi:Rab family GTPase [Candidatus Hodarchaeum mangrovi]